MGYAAVQVMLVNSSLQVGTLLYCATSHLYDNVVTTTCEQWMELVGSAKTRDRQGAEAWSVGALGKFVTASHYARAITIMH